MLKVWGLSNLRLRAVGLQVKRGDSTRGPWAGRRTTVKSHP